MAITRAQQFKQMLQDGGMLVSPSTTGKRPGYRGDDARKSAAAMGKGAMGRCVINHCKCISKRRILVSR